MPLVLSKHLLWEKGPRSFKMESRLAVKYYGANRKQLSSAILPSKTVYGAIRHLKISFVLGDRCVTLDPDRL
jgi:hypothetical protein